MNRKKHRHFLLLTGLTIVLLVAGCNRKNVYSRYVHTPVDGWGQTDTLLFEVAPIPEDGCYEEEIGLRCNTTYPFQELALVVAQKVARRDGQGHDSLVMVGSDTVMFRITDEDGDYMGEGIHYMQYTVKLPDVNLHARDSLHVSVCHIMRRRNIPGIADVGFTLRKQ